MAYYLTPDLHACVWWFWKWKINPCVLKIKAIGKNNGELIGGEISEEENLILPLMEEHLLFISLSSKRYATLQLNQLTQSLLIILGHEHPAPMAGKTQDSCWDTRKGSPVAKAVLLSQALGLGSMDGSAQPVPLCSLGPCLMLHDLTVPTIFRPCRVTGWWQRWHTPGLSSLPLWHSWAQRSLHHCQSPGCLLPASGPATRHPHGFGNVKSDHKMRSIVSVWVSLQNHLQEYPKQIL